MASYAAVISLMNTMDAAMNDTRLYPCFDKQQIQSLGEKLDVLLQFIENYDYNSHGRDETARSLELRIASAAHAAEDVIESHILAQIHAGVLEDAPTSCIDLHQIMQDIDEIKEEAVKVEVKTRSTDEKPKRSPQPLPTGKTTMIGFDDYLIQLLDGLTGSESGQLVIPIVGMGGVGKTTFTKNAYENLLTMQHFDVRAWVPISQQYDVNNILVQLLSTLGQSTKEKNVENLKDNSRIIVTTRLLEVANAFDSRRVVRVGLLDDSKSWDLFCYKVFGQEVCPDELEQIGKAIAKKCKGLPLLLDVIGAILGNSSQTKEYWLNIAENMSSILSSAVDNVDCLDILCLSYYHLPAHLKPCFLYLGMFEEDAEIPVSQLMKLWIAEGFIKPHKDKLPQKVAEGYINDLFERSLFLVDSLGWDKKFTSFHIHDLVRDLCLREAQKEKFYFVISKDSKVQDVKGARRLVYSEYWGIDERFPLKSVARSMSFHKAYFHRDQHSSGFELLRVSYKGRYSDKYSFTNVNMRFLFSPSFYIDNLPPSIFLLWNMQTFLIEHYECALPAEMWKMRQLRHVEFYRVTLPEPPLSDEEDESVVLHNLQTLTQVLDFKISEEVCKRIPNIRRLGVFYQDFSKNSNDCCFHNFGRLIKLESLSLRFSNDVPVRNYLEHNLIFPPSLKELSLRTTKLDWDDMRIIGSLPILKVLKLIKCSFVDKEWTCVEGGFLALKYLQIRWCDCIRWNVESSNFPALETLVLEYMYINEIPSSIPDIPTLRIVRLIQCWHSLMISAMKMLEEQETLGNDSLQLQLEFHKKQIMKEFLEEVEEEGITCTNFNYTISNQ